MAKKDQVAEDEKMEITLGFRAVNLMRLSLDTLKKIADLIAKDPKKD